MALSKVSQKRCSEVVKLDESFKISVIIPVYNTAPYLKRCLESVIGNSYKNLEIICVNDGSIDDSLDILNTIASTDCRVIIINKENEGVSEARNVALKVSTGDFIAFIDSDDWIHPQYFEILMKVINAYQANIAVCQFESVSQILPFTYFDEEDMDVQVLSFADAISIGHVKRMVWAHIYKREVVINHFFVKGIIWGEDSVFNVGILQKEGDLRTVCLNEKLYYYFQRETSAVHTVNVSARIAVAKWYLENISDCHCDYSKKIFIEESIKNTLSCQYKCIVAFEKQYYQEIKELTYHCQRLLKVSKVFTIKERLKYGVLLAYPQIYRLYRIHNDKSLLVWEKNQKEKKTKYSRITQSVESK